MPKSQIAQPVLLANKQNPAEEMAMKVLNRNQVVKNKTGIIRGFLERIFKR